MSDTPSSTSSTSSTVANHYLCTNTIATPERELVELKRKLADWLNAFKADPFSTGESKVDRLIEVATIESLLADKARLLEAVTVAATIFRTYEKLHRDKGTEEGDLKAKTNAIAAEGMEAALNRSQNT